jgi:hypothetical protein
MRRVPRTALVIGGIIVAAQCVRFARTNPPVRGDLVAPAEVKNILRRACYDCHSNETAWPWYSAIAPASWVICHDVNEGRRRLNFSTWGDYVSDPDTAARKLSEILKFVANDDMAPRYYRMLHPTARLTVAQRDLLVRWVKQETAGQPASH